MPTYDKYTQEHQEIFKHTYLILRQLFASKPSKEQYLINENMSLDDRVLSTLAKRGLVKLSRGTITLTLLGLSVSHYIEEIEICPKIKAESRHTHIELTGADDQDIEYVKKLLNDPEVIRQTYSE